MYIKQINKPKKRSPLRKIVGKEFFVLKRKIKWLSKYKDFAYTEEKTSLKYSIINHKSFLIRPLKDVDMYLQYNKVQNLKLAISKIDKVLIKPGQIFSVWKLIGRPKKTKGYLTGLILNNGKISKGTGGGLCQLGNLIYWMALHTPLTIKERWRHSYDVFPDINRTIPFGCGATLCYNYIDLQLKNETDYTFQIKLWLDDEFLNGEIKCNSELKLKYKIYETDHIIKHQWWGGYTRHNKIWKHINNLNNNTQSEEFVTDNNAIMMYNPLLGK